MNATIEAIEDKYLLWGEWRVQHFTLFGSVDRFAVYKLMPIK